MELQNSGFIAKVQCAEVGGVSVNDTKDAKTGILHFLLCVYRILPRYLKVYWWLLIVLVILKKLVALINSTDKFKL